MINTWLHGWCWCQSFSFSSHGTFFDEYRLLRRDRIHHQPVPWGPWHVFHPMDFCIYMFLRWSRIWPTPRAGRTSFPLSLLWDSGTPEICEEQLQVKTELEKSSWVPQPSPFWLSLILHLIYWGNRSWLCGLPSEKQAVDWADPTAWTACGAGGLFLFALVRPQLWSTVQDKHGSGGASPREGHRNALRAEAPPLWRWAERDKGIQPREEKAPGRFPCSLSASFKGGL